MTSELRALIIAPQPFFTNRGTPINVKAMTDALCASGWSVDLLVYPQGEAISTPPQLRVIRSSAFPGVRDVPIGPSWQKAVLDLGISWSALRLAATRRYSLFHGVEEGGVIASILSAIFRTPYIFDMDSCMVDQLRTSGFLRSRPLLKFIEWLESGSIRRSAAVLTVCEELSRKAESIAPGARIFQIEDFAPDNAFLVTDEEGRAARAKLGLSDRPLLVYTGNFESYQGLDLLLESFAVMKQSGSPQIPTLLLVGGGAGDIAQYREKAAALGVADNIVTAGERPGGEMPAFLKAADALVSPRISGVNTPLKIYGYMAAERPIVATNIRSHTQVLTDESAWLAGTDPRSFAESVHRALDRSETGAELNRRKAAASRSYAEAKFRRSEFERRLNELYRFVSGREAPSSGAAANIAAAGSDDVAELSPPPVYGSGASTGSATSR